MKLKIELKSDLCTYAGESFNSQVDLEVVHDECGFPYIPAKRIKGCLREAALELMDFGVISKEEYISVFGKGGKSSSRFSIGNAYLIRYKEMREDLQKNGDKQLTHPQNVLNLYTYTRTQTAMTVNGVADESSLRTIRVVKRGVVFESEIILDNGSEEIWKVLDKAAGQVKHIGLGRTRGLGQVELVLESLNDKSGNNPGSKSGNNSDNNESYNFKSGKCYRIDYTVRLKSNLLCKSVQGTAARTVNYIEGNKIVGRIAQVMGQEAFKTLLQGDEWIVSNAYIAAGNKRCTPVMCSLQKVKDQDYINGGMVVNNLLKEYTGNEQLASVGNIFVAQDGTVKTVDTEIHYHHQRPGDKSIGRAMGNDDASFYQLESICSGQEFKGFILAHSAEAEEIFKVLKKEPHFRMGYGRSSEYGAVELMINEPYIIKDSSDDNSTKEVIHDFVLKLNAPIVIYNAVGMPSADIEDLVTYVKARLDVDDLTVNPESCFLSYEEIGGFNVTWQRRKPNIITLGKGTVCMLHTDKGADISLLENYFLGERVNEGYGEIEVMTSPDSQFVLKKADLDKSLSSSAFVQTDIIKKLTILQLRAEIEKVARKSAEIIFGKIKNDKEADAVIGRLLLISKNDFGLQDMNDQIAGIETVSKRRLAEEVIESVNEFCSWWSSQLSEETGQQTFENTQKSATGKVQKVSFINDRILNIAKTENIRMTIDEVFKTYADVYLNDIKYRLRPGKKERRSVQ